MNSAPFFKEREWSLLALQVWMPMNGNTNNQGIGDITISGSPSYTENGKLGTKYLSSSSNIYIDVPAITSTKTCTFAFWAYVINESITSNWTKVATIHDQGTNSGSNMRIEVCPKNFQNGIYCFSNHNNTSYGLTSGSIVSPTGGYYDEWVHFCFVSDGTIFSRYMNGELIGTCPYDGKATFSGRFGLLNNNICYKQDIRIYDNALSPREIKELAKGLICHYPLNDPYPTASINKYSGDYFEGRANNGGGDDITCTKLENERGYNYKYIYTGTGTNSWKSINFPVFSFTPGKKYDYSCKVRCNACTSNVFFELRASRMNNDWDRPKQATVCSSSLADGKWHEYHLIITLEETSDRSGTTYKTAPLIEFYTGAMTTKDAVFSFDFDLKDVQVTECDVNTPISNGAWNDGIVYDVSGYGNHGSAKSDYISYNNDSPRYDGSYKLLNGKQVYVYIPNFAFENMSKGTVNIWINRHSTDDVWRTYLYFANSYNWVGQALDFIIIGSTGSQSITMDCCSNCSTREPALNTWNMYTITWDLETHTSKHYFNGNLINTITNDRIDTEYASKHNGHFIGNIYTKDNSSTSDYSLSDFRLYATTLSDQDIKQLYDTPVSLTNNGTLMTQGEFKEM